MKGEEFSLRLCYPFSIRNHPSSETRSSLCGTDRTIESLTHALPIPANLKSRLKERLSLPLWQPSSRDVSTDLYPHIRRLLANDEPHSLDLNRSYALGEVAWQLLDGEIGRHGDGLEFRLTRAAAERLKLPTLTASDTHWMPFSFCQGHVRRKLNPPRLTIFGSGIGLLEFELSTALPTLNPDLTCTEFTHALAHIGKTAPSVRWRNLDSAEHDSTTLYEIIRAVLPISNPNQIDSNVSSRLFSFACLRISEDLPDMSQDELTHRLAHRQTNHYLPNSQVVSQFTFTSFENITHCVSAEGGAVVIHDSAVDNQQVDFFQHYISSVVKDAYWPLAMLAYAEFQKLVQLTGDICRNVNFVNPDPADLAALENHFQDMLDFRLNFRFSQASQIMHHNHYFNRWRTVLGCDRLLEEMASDMQETTSYLSHRLDVERNEQERLYAEASRIRDLKNQDQNERYNRSIGYFGILVSALVLLTGLLGSNVTEFSDNKSIFDPFILKTIGCVVLIALAAIGVKWMLDRRQDRVRETRMQAGTDTFAASRTTSRTVSRKS